MIARIPEAVTMKQKSFRFCMLASAVALLSIAIFYFTTYLFRVSVALDNNDLEPFIERSVRALWLCFASQALLIGLLYLLVAFRPHTVSREVIVLLGLGQLVEMVLLLVFADSRTVASLLAIASLFVLCGSLLWPKYLPADVAAPAPAPARLPDNAAAPAGLLETQPDARRTPARND